MKHGMSIKRLRTALAVLIVILMPVIPTASALADASSAIGAKPAKPRADNQRSNSIFVHQLKPGASVEEAIMVINNTDSEKRINIYGVDSQLASGGTFGCAQKADTPSAVGTWLKLSQPTVTIGPKMTQNVPFTIQVPDNASPGEQNGCIALEDAGQTPVNQGNGIALSFRSAIRVAVTVPKL